MNPLPWGEAHIYYFLWIFICHDILFGQAAAKFYFALPRANNGQEAQCDGVSSDRRAAAVFGDPPYPPLICVCMLGGDSRRSPPGLGLI